MCGREHGQAALPGVRALARQLCLRVLDKAEQRAAAVASVRELVRGPCRCRAAAINDMEQGGGLGTCQRLAAFIPALACAQSGVLLLTAWRELPLVVLTV